MLNILNYLCNEIKMIVGLIELQNMALFYYQGVYEYL